MLDYQWDFCFVIFLEFIHSAAYYYINVLESEKDLKKLWPEKCGKNEKKKQQQKFKSPNRIRNDTTATNAVAVRMHFNYSLLLLSSCLVCFHLDFMFFFFDIPVTG